MGVRADSVVSGEELVGGLMEPGVSGREMAKMELEIDGSCSFT